MKKTAKRIFILFIVLSLISTLIFLLNPIFLTKNDMIKSDILVIEGWLDAQDVELLLKKVNADELETIYVTGIAHEFAENIEIDTTFPYMFRSNGTMLLHRSEQIDIRNTEISIYAHGTKALNRYPQLCLATETKILADTFVNEEPSVYHFKNIDITDNKRVFLSYVNDANYEGEDRNLYVDSIYINNRKAVNFTLIPDYKLNTEVQSNYPFRSKAERTAFYIRSLNVNCEVLAVDTFFNKRNKTIAAARKLAETLKNNHPKSMNIASVYGHSRRSFLAYKSAFPNSTIGVISIDNRKYRKKVSKARRIYQIADEYVSILVTSAICLYSLPLK